VAPNQAEPHKKGRKKEKKKPDKAHHNLFFFLTAVWRALTQAK
jgi:hypothetical protein